MNELDAFLPTPVCTPLLRLPDCLNFEKPLITIESIALKLEIPVSIVLPHAANNWQISRYVILACDDDDPSLVGGLLSITERSICITLLVDDAARTAPESGEASN